MGFGSLGKTLDTERDWILYDIAHWMQHGPDRQQTRALRGVGKSYTCSNFAAWNIYSNPDISIIIVSAAANLAQDFLGLTRKLLDAMEVCHHLRPRADDKDGAFQFVSAARTRPQKDPTVWACGITSSKTGHHADLIIVDDAETPENSDDPDKRERLLGLLAELEDLLNPGGRIVYLNTPQHNQSVYLTLEKRGYASRTWPSQYPHPSDTPYVSGVAPAILARLAGKLPGAAPGEPTYPSRFSRDYLADKEARYGRARFTLQMNCDTRLSDQDKYPLRLMDFMVHSIHHDSAPKRIVWGTSEPYDGASIEMAQGSDKFYRPIMVSNDYVNFEYTVMFIDPSGGGTVSGDEVAWAVGKVANGMIYIVDTGGLMGGHCEANMKHLARRAKAHDCNHVLVEGNYGKGMFAKLLAPYMGDINGPTLIEDVYSSNTQKEKRIIDSLYTPMKGHRIVIDEVVAKDSVLMAQLTNITYKAGSLRHDDRVEALASCVAHLVQYLPSISIEKTQLEQDKRELEAVWKKHMSNRHSVVREVDPNEYRRNQSPSVLSRVNAPGSDRFRAKMRSIINASRSTRR